MLSKTAPAASQGEVVGEGGEVGARQGGVVVTPVLVVQTAIVIITTATHPLTKTRSVTLESCSETRCRGYI